MLYFLRCFLLFLLVLLFNFTQAAHSVVITLEEALEMGVLNNLNLQKNLIDLSGAQHSRANIWAQVFPTISAGAGIAYSQGLFSPTNPVSGGLSTSANFSISLNLNAGLPYTMRNIRLAYQVRLLDYESARNQLEIQITKNFFSLIAERDNLAVLAEMQNLAQMQLQRNEIAFRNGIVNELTLMQSRFAMESARYNLSVAQQNYAGRVNDFLLSLGFDHNSEAWQETEFQGNIEISKVELDAENLIAENLYRRPDITGRRWEIQRLENIERQSTLSSRAPSLSLQAAWNANSFDPINDTIRGSATLNIPIDPWIPGTRSDQTIQSARDAILKARLDLQSTEEQAAAQIRSLSAALTGTWSNIEIARLSVAIAERGYELTELGFRNGTLDSLRLEDARGSLAASRQRLLQSELVYLNMILDISASLNVNWKEFL